jgi:hypothetical protein
MRLSNDLKEFLESLNSRGVDYVIVGAHSLAFHGRPGYTGDLDILVRATSGNASKLVDLICSDSVKSDSLKAVSVKPN